MFTFSAVIPFIANLFYVLNTSQHKTSAKDYDTIT